MEIVNAQNVSLLIFFIGFAGLLIRQNMIKSVVCVGVMQAAIILFYVTATFTPGSVPPIGIAESTLAADPLPQALMLTEIVIGVGVTATALTLFIHLYHGYGTTNWLIATAKRMEGL